MRNAITRVTHRFLNRVKKAHTNIFNFQISEKTGNGVFLKNDVFSEKKTPK